MEIYNEDSSDNIVVIPDENDEEVSEDDTLCSGFDEDDDFLNDVSNH